MVSLLPLQERDPLKLLRPLADTLAARRVQLAGALFVPPDSTYGSLASRGPSADLSWQQQLRGTWEAVGKWQPAAAAAGRRPQPLLPLPLLAGVAAQDVARGAVLPNLQVSQPGLGANARTTLPPSVCSRARESAGF